MGNRKKIEIRVENKHAFLVNESDYLVNGNSDYDVHFSFDEDWDGVVAKTALFVFGNQSIPVPFEGNICDGVATHDCSLCAIGVFAGDLKTTTGATIRCVQSIRDLGGVPEAPSKEVYDIIMALLDKAIQAHTELPTGGKAGQVLTKKSEKDYDTEWTSMTDEKGTIVKVNGEAVSEFDADTKADIQYVDNKIGDIQSALEELHTYAQSLIGGCEE